MVETDEGSNNETKEPETLCPRSVMKLTVQNPVTRTTDVGRYTTYEITLETTHIAFTLSKSCVRRRYSDLVWLRSWFAYNCPDRILPAIPPKKFFSARFGDDVIETRRLGYQRFLRRLLEEGAYLSEGCLHLFLQTPLSVEEIAECMRSHSSAADIIRMVEMFSVTSPSGDSVLYCHDNCSVYGSSKPSELQTPETRVCHLVAGNGGLTNNLSDSTNSQGDVTSTASTSGISSFDDKSDTSLTSSSSHAGDGLVSLPVGNDELRDKKTIEKVTFMALVEDVSGGGLSDPC